MGILCEQLADLSGINPNGLIYEEQDYGKKILSMRPPSILRTQVQTPSPKVGKYIRDNVYEEWTVYNHDKIFMLVQALEKGDDTIESLYKDYAAGGYKPVMYTNTAGRWVSYKNATFIGYDTVMGDYTIHAFHPYTGDKTNDNDMLMSFILDTVSLKQK
jgi:hypothetical protein